MIATADKPRARPARLIPPLENGDMLSLAEFLRRYEDMHDIKKAELIEGVTRPRRTFCGGWIDSWLVGALFD